MEIKQLLSNVGILLEQHRKIEILKGERFNVFSILRMETKENDTHSNFLAELLNPKGSHMLGDVLLRHFLEVIGIEENYLDTKSATITVEFSIGKVNYDNKTGGRIDILIQDVKGKSITIENKIYATDQHAQIDRYLNYNFGNNLVLYLTLFGTKPSDASTDKEESDFFKCISYKKNITKWLQHCQKEATEQPILRETIRQYIILLQKLTNTMDDKEQIEIERLILSNYEEAHYIANNLVAAKNRVFNLFRNAVKEKLENIIKDDYTVTFGMDVSKSYSQLWMEKTGKVNENFMFGIEYFNDAQNVKGLLVGIFDKKFKDSENINEVESEGEELNRYNFAWPDHIMITQFEYQGENTNLDLRDSNLLVQLFNNSFLDNLASQVAIKTTEYIRDKEKLIYK